MKLKGVERVRAHALRPHGHLFRQALVAVLAFFAPVFAVLFWLTIPMGVWLPVAVAVAVVVLGCGFCALAFFRAGIWVDTAGVTERGFLGRTESVPIAKVGSALMLELYQRDALDTNPQLFVTSIDGRLLLRMRGQFWPRESMELVVDQLGAPLVRVEEPMTMRELNRVRPELLYWFERRLLNRVT